VGSTGRRGPGELLAEVAGLAPLLPAADQLAFADVDVDVMQRRVYGHKMRGATFGHNEISGKTVLVRGRNTLAPTISTPQAVPVIAGTRLRGGSANSARGAAAFAAEAISAARAAGCTGTIVARADSRFYGAASTGACRRVGARSSVTARMAPAVKAAIALIPEDAVHHRPADRPRGPRPEPQSRRGAGRAVPGMALPPRSSCYRPRATTATMPWCSGCSRTDRRPHGSSAISYRLPPTPRGIRRDLIDVAARTARHGRGEDKLYGHIKPRKTRAPFLEFCRYLRSLCPPEVRIAIICHNFSPHLTTKRDARVGTWATANNAEIAYSPSNASWFNRIEAKFTALRYFALDGTDHTSHREQASMIRRYIIWRNGGTTTLATNGPAASLTRLT
jgi:hypothetical protein